MGYWNLFNTGLLAVTRNASQGSVIGYAQDTNHETWLHISHYNFWAKTPFPTPHTTQTKSLFFSKSLFAKFLHEYFDHITFYTAVILTENPEPPLPQPIATNGAGVCQYDITNATANYNTVSMTTLGHQFKDKQIIIATWMHHMYSKKKKIGKRGQETSKGLWAP